MRGEREGGRGRREGGGEEEVLMLGCFILATSVTNLQSYKKHQFLVSNYRYSISHLELE